MYKIIDLTGQKFGRWTVLRQVTNSATTTGGSTWLCRCDCGTEKKHRSHTLRIGHTRSCGCWRGELVGNNKRKPAGDAAKHALFVTYKNKANRRKLEWALTEEQFLSITSQPCLYCGTPPLQISQGHSHNGPYAYNGIDRVKNESGYFYDNSVPCCGICNFAKRSLSQEDFYAWIDRIVAHRKNTFSVQNP